MQPTSFVYHKYGSLSIVSHLSYHESFLCSPSSWSPKSVEAGKGSYGRVIFFTSDVPYLGLMEYNGLLIENGKLVSKNHQGKD